MREDKSMKKVEEAKIAFEEYKKEKIKIIEENLKLKGITKAKFYFPITKLLLNLITISNGERIYYLNEKNVKTPKNRPIIYANTHKFKPDIEKISLSTNKPSVMTASDFINSYKTISGWYFNTRPTIFIDPYSKEDKKYTYKMIVRYLKEGNNCMIFPEAVWNLSPNKIVLDIFSGTVRAALESNSVIVCTAIERYGKNYVINKKDFFDPKEILEKYTNKSFDELNTNPDYLSLRNKIVEECNSILRDKLATLTYEIWEAHSNAYGFASRETLNEKHWENYINELTQEWPGYKLSDNLEQQFQNKSEIEYMAIEEDIKNLRKNLDINNLFLFTDYSRYEKARELIQNYSNEDKPKVKVLKK